MHGDFTVGSGARPLTAFVVAGKAPVLRDAFNLPIKTSVAGRRTSEVSVPSRVVSYCSDMRGTGSE